MIDVYVVLCLLAWEVGRRDGGLQRRGRGNEREREETGKLLRGERSQKVEAGCTCSLLSTTPKTGINKNICVN